MTDNKTIDGVSRATVENAIEALTRHLSGHAPMQVPPSKSDSDMVREELRALLDADKVNNRQLGIMQFVEAHPIAPAVERQEPKGSGSLEFDSLLAEFHAVVWASAEEGDCDYDLAGVDVAKKLQAMFRQQAALKTVHLDGLDPAQRLSLSRGEKAQQ